MEKHAYMPMKRCERHMKTRVCIKFDFVMNNYVRGKCFGDHGLVSSTGFSNRSRLGVLEIGARMKLVGTVSSCLIILLGWR